MSPNLTAPASVQNPNELCCLLAVTPEHSGENRHVSSGVQGDEHCGGTCTSREHFHFRLVQIFWWQIIKEKMEINSDYEVIAG